MLRQMRGASESMKGTEQEHGQRAHAVAVGHASHRRRAAYGLSHRRWSGLRRKALYLVRSRFLRRVLWGSAICVAVVTVAVLGLWWRLSSGPIEFDLATPWLKAA